MTTVKLIIIDASKQSLNKVISKTNLDDNEIILFDKYKTEEGKKEKILSYYLKKKYIKDYYIDDNGKPLSNNIFFNISHSGGNVILGLNDKHQIGVDVEVIRKINIKLRKHISSDEEYSCIHTDEDFFKLWTNKEAIVKCLGSGIRMDMKLIPGLPFEGIRTINNRIINNKIIKIDDKVIAVSLESDEDFKIDINKLDI